VYVALGKYSECTSNADCAGKDVYCIAGECQLMLPEQMATCESDADCADDYACVAGRCGKRPLASPPAPRPKPPGSAPAPAKAEGFDLAFIVVAGAVVGGLAYLYGRKG
jgi:hypothetical protein